MRKWSYLLRVLLIAALVLALGIAPAFAAGTAARINDSDAKIYTGAHKTTSLKAGTEVSVKAVQNGWAKIGYKGKLGYVSTKYLTAEKGKTGYVVRNAVIHKDADKDSAKLGKVAVGAKLKVVGAQGNFYQVTNGKAYGYIAKGALSDEEPSRAERIAARVKKVQWSKGNKLFPAGSYAYLYDIQSGLTIRVYRLGGSKHAELEPATAKDTGKLLKASGGEFSWASRPVILITKGGKCIPAAINTMPHGEQTITNNDFDGQFCLHLPGSRTHGSDTVNVNHQAAIRAAIQWAKALRK